MPSMTDPYDIPEGLSPEAERLHRALLATGRCSAEYRAYADANAVAAARALLASR